MRPSLPLLTMLMLGAAAAPARGSTAAEPPAVAVGRQLYATGLHASGQPIRAVVQGDVAVPPAGAACITCHRRSGLGTVEGRSRSAALTGPLLFAPRTGGVPRPAYDAALLHRALTTGVAANGQKLDSLMPRYTLAREESDALAAYLHTLGAGPVPGLTPTELTIATVIADDAPVAAREAMEKVLDRFVATKNGGSRHEVARAKFSNRHPWGERGDRAYRHWRLLTWRLHGEPHTWPEQLRRYQAADPVFAVVGGTAGRDWPVVHEYCESAHLPCLLPLTDLPPEPPRGTDPGFYSLYFNAGVRLEARVTARAITGAADTAPDARVVVVHDDSDQGRAAWAALLSAWPAGRPAPLERVVVQGRHGDPHDWQLLVGEARPDVLVAWVDRPQLQGLLSAATLPFLPKRVYTAEAFTDLETVDVATVLRERLRHVYPWRVPRSREGQFPRERTWLKQQGLEGLDPRLAGRALFAAHVFGEGVASLRNAFSQDYLMEDLEHMLDGSDMTTLLPRTSLAPGQRFLSRGAYVLALSPRPGDPYTTPTWLEPQ